MLSSGWVWKSGFKVWFHSLCAKFRLTPGEPYTTLALLVQPYIFFLDKWLFSLTISLAWFKYKKRSRNVLCLLDHKPTLVILEY